MPHLGPCQKLVATPVFHATCVLKVCYNPESKSEGRQCAPWEMPQKCKFKEAFREKTETYLGIKEHKQTAYYVCILWSDPSIEGKGREGKNIKIHSHF